MNKQLLIVLINYNTTESIFDCLNSIFATDYEKFKSSISIYLVDNSEVSDPRLIEKLKENKTVKYIKTTENIGYFGAAHYGYNYYLSITNKNPDWIIISNVDVIYKGEHFFEQIFNIPSTKNIGLIAPSIFAKHTGKYLNPLLLSRPTSFRMKFYKYVFKYHFTCAFYLFLSVAKTQMQKNFPMNHKEQFVPETNIYAPYGSVMIFSKMFFEKGGTFKYPCFLFEEELYVAEQARLLNLKIIYKPELTIFDIGHVSTNMVPSSQICKYYSDSAKYIYDTYFRS